MSEVLTETIEEETKKNASQIGLTSGVMYRLYADKFAVAPLMLSLFLVFPLGAIAVQGYTWAVFLLALFITLRESLGVVEYAYLYHDDVFLRLLALARKMSLINCIVFALIGLVTFFFPAVILPSITAGIALGGLCFLCAPLFGIVGANYLLAAAKVDVEKTAAANKYSSMIAGVTCSLSYFLVAHPSSVKMLGVMCIVNFFNFLLLTKTDITGITEQEWAQVRYGATNYKEPTLNFAYFLGLFVSMIALFVYFNYAA